MGPYYVTRDCPSFPLLAAGIWSRLRRDLASDRRHPATNLKNPKNLKNLKNSSPIPASALYTPSAIPLSFSGTRG